MDRMQKLMDIRSHHELVETVGLQKKYVEQFLEEDPRLGELIDEAWTLYQDSKKMFASIFKRDEAHQIEEIQRDYLNFYEEMNVNPYVALAAKGPWIITTCGSVVYDVGGYGMLGLGHNPEHLLRALAKPQAMANIMTPNLIQWKFTQVLRGEIGQHRSDGRKYFKYLCINSGSEAITVACRIIDRYAKMQTDAGGSHSAKKLMYLTLKGSFHGRTETAAQLSSSSLESYQDVLASFRDKRSVVTVEANNIAELNSVFEWAEREGVFIQAMFLEPVMGEGDPGKAITPEFYKVARERTTKHGALLVVDSIQAGLRTQACLSIVDYPGFESLAFPDMETYSKALNNGQYPLSVLALNEKAARLYKHGLYGNTMTTNPRALELATQVLYSMTPELRENIHRQGARLLEGLRGLAKEFPKLVGKVQGTGLLLSLAIDPQCAQVLGEKGMERYLRHNGLGVIHGGKNALRFTPVFNITDTEVDLIVTLLKKAFHEFSK